MSTKSMLDEVQRMTRLYKAFADVEVTLKDLHRVEQQHKELTSNVGSLKKTVEELENRHRDFSDKLARLDEEYTAREKEETISLGDILAVMIKEAESKVESILQGESSKVLSIRQEGTNLLARNQQLQISITDKETRSNELEGKISLAESKIKSILGT